MRKIYFFYLNIVAFFFISSCKKEYPVVSNNEPVFYFKGMVNGSPVSIQAGINNYYMYSSFFQDSATHVYRFWGDLKQTNCSNCINRIRVQINDYKVSSLNASVVIDSLKVRYYPIQVPNGTSPIYSVHFFPTDSANSYSWSFGDATTSTQAYPMHTYSLAGTYNVCLTTIGDSNCTSSVCNKIKVGATCNANISGNTTIYNGDSATLSASFNPSCSNISYKWNNGSVNSYINVTPSSTTTYYVIATCPSSNCSDTAFVTVNVVPVSQNCISNFGFHVDSTNSANPLALSNVTITWTDNLGNVYTSNNSSQPTDSYFQIVSVDSYPNNELGQYTKKLHVKFKCKVFGSSNSLPIDNGDAVIAVAYK